MGVIPSRVIGPIDTEVAAGHALGAALPISIIKPDIVTATRLVEIARRNRLRNEFSLPRLSVATECRRMHSGSFARSCPVCLGAGSGNPLEAAVARLLVPSAGEGIEMALRKRRRRK